METKNWTPQPPSPLEEFWQKLCPTSIQKITELLFLSATATLPPSPASAPPPSPKTPSLTPFAPGNSTPTPPQSAFSPPGGTTGSWPRPHLFCCRNGKNDFFFFFFKKKRLIIKDVIIGIGKRNYNNFQN